jgi:uncharacterized protein YjbI with pentapeptide repeats
MGHVFCIEPSLLELQQAPQAISKRKRARDVLRDLTCAGDAADGTTYSLRDVQIEGKLDLRNFTVEVAVDIQRCEFLDEVDLSHCEFKQVVNFTGCTFNKDFCSEDKVQAHTIFKKDLICDGVLFKGNVNLSGAHVEGDMHFSRATLEDNAICKITAFRGKVNFVGLKCGGGVFRGTRFEYTDEDSDEGDSASDGYAVAFSRSSFEGPLECQEAVFNAPVSFNSTKCARSAFFTKTRFEGIQRNSNNYAAHFTAACFSQQAVFSSTRFRGSVSFNSIMCEGAAFFTDANFEGQNLNMRFASFGENLTFEGATFAANSVETDSDFRHLNVKGDLSFERAYCDSVLKLGHARIGRKLRLGGSCFKNRVEFYHATIEIIEILDVYDTHFPIEARVTQYRDHLRPVVENRKTLQYLAQNKCKQCQVTWQSIVDGLYPFRSGDVNVAHIAFHRFQGGPNRRLEKDFASRFAREQHVTEFSRAPHLQLERYYSSVGDDAEAKRMYYRGRSELRENALNKLGRTQWSRRTRWIDWWIKCFTGYGVHTWLLLIWIIGFLVVGTVIFWPNDTLDPVSKDINAQLGWSTFREHLLDRGSYSLDLFLPIVNLHVDEKWQPHEPWRQFYAIFHSMVGWVLVPLLLASLSGIIRRE